MRLHAVVLGVVLAAPSFATAVLIDSFRDEAPALSAPGSKGRASASRSDAAAHAIGGTRDMVVRRDSLMDHGVENSKGPVQADVGYWSPDAFNFATGALAKGSALVTWAGSGDERSASTPDSNVPSHFGLRARGEFGGAEPVGIDMTDRGANNGVSFSAYSDLGADVTLAFYRSATEFVTAVIRIPAGYAPGEPPILTEFFVPLTDFVATGVLSPMTVFQDTRAITMLVSGPQGVDVMITDLETTELPEPAGTAIAGIVLIGAGVLRFKVRSRANGA